jgi:hypothetical protein
MPILLLKFHKVVRHALWMGAPWIITARFAPPAATGSPGIAANWCARSAATT